MGIWISYRAGLDGRSAWDCGHGWAVAQHPMFVEVSGVARRSSLLVSSWRGVAVLVVACTAGRLRSLVARSGLPEGVCSPDAPELPLVAGAFRDAEDRGR